ncbi:MAG TPA: sensor histidine kinase, partial [Spirochaetia bacterium]|nr:sensor histidine kinase [Spirochaetia bacterium]
EVRLLHASARERVVQVKLFPVRLSGKVVVGALLEDVTEKKHTERLLEDSRKELRNLALHLLAAREEERRSVAIDIHDELGQSLTALKMDILQLGKRVGGRRKPEREKLADMTAVIDQTLSAVQRIATELRPRMLDDLGLAATISWLCEDFSRRTGFPCTAQIMLREPGPVGAVATSIYRIAQELLTNVARHAMARRVSVQLREIGQNLRLLVQDDGVGITPQQASSPDSIGLIGIRERVGDLRGRFSIAGTKGGGTRARISIPLRWKEPSG